MKVERNPKTSAAAGFRQISVLGIGAPVIDLLIRVDHDYLRSLPGAKNTMEMVDHEEMLAIIKNSGAIPKFAAGGSSANTIKILARLGHQCAFTGKIGKDYHGEKLQTLFNRMNVKTLFNYSPTPTGNVLCLIAPDGNRTFRSFLGASLEMTPQDLKPDFFRGVKLVHIEGYSLVTPDLTQKAMAMARENGALVSFDICSYRLVEQHKKFIIDLIAEYVDILFANEDETASLTGSPPEKGCDIISQLCPYAVVMVGEHGAIIGHENKIEHYPTEYVQPIDTTGAGDFFAAGFLHGLLGGQSIASAALGGSSLAGKVITQIGTDIPEKEWSGIARQEPFKSRNEVFQ